VTKLFDEALERPAETRAAFLKSACAGDDVLLREVESLLAQDTGFLKSPAVAAVADEIGEDEKPGIGEKVKAVHNDETLGQIPYREQLFVSLLLDLATVAGDNAEELMTRL
jgi:hypothetical protein